MPDIARTTSAPPPLWQQQRDEAIQLVETNAGPDFIERACEFVIGYLKSNGPTSGELITDACKRAGIVPHNDKAFGPVYLRLARRGVIAHAGYARRAKGHGTGGATVWKLAN